MNRSPRPPRLLGLAAVAVAVIALASGCAFEAAPSPPPASPSPVSRSSAPPAATQSDADAAKIQRSDKNLPNFAVVEPGIYRGAAPTDAGLERLKALGVRTVIDLRIERKGQAQEAATAKRLGLNRIRIPMGREAPTEKQVATFLKTLDDPAARPVFVHCQWGADRTGAMVGIRRVTKNGWTFDKTYAEMRTFGFKPFLTELKSSVRKRAAN